jgi:hypothetical protein
MLGNQYLHILHNCYAKGEGDLIIQSTVVFHTSLNQLECFLFESLTTLYVVEDDKELVTDVKSVAFVRLEKVACSLYSQKIL